MASNSSSPPRPMLVASLNQASGPRIGRPVNLAMASTPTTWLSLSLTMGWKAMETIPVDSAAEMRLTVSLRMRDCSSSD